MVRPLRIEYPGATCHITSRGNERKEIFKDDKDRRKFLETLSQSREIYNIEVFSYVLMKNHFHLLIKTPLGNLSMFMRHFNITYTSYFNRRHKRVGHLYQGRYKSMVIDSEEYLSVVSRYIHLNPVRVKTIRKKSIEEKINYLKNYKWSSFPGFIGRKKMEELVNYEPVLLDFGGVNAGGRKEYQELIFSNISDGLEIKNKVIAQSILGGEEFVEWIKNNFLEKERDRERPPLHKIQKYKAKEVIIEVVEKETGKSIDWIRKERGITRQITMDLLYRLGGLKGRTIADIFEVDYSTVSIGRKRLREKAKKEESVMSLIQRCEANLSMLKI
tara:strand:+ start:376 stop:1365 length:990 start_codon:yes stop_codon:yes gene_type:complete